MNTKLLTEDEWRVLDKVAEFSKEDFWFYLRHDDEKNVDYIYDLMINKPIDLIDGITNLNGFITLETYESLNDVEKETYDNLLKRFEIIDR